MLLARLAVHDWLVLGYLLALNLVSLLVARGPGRAESVAETGGLLALLLVGLYWVRRSRGALDPLGPIVYRVALYGSVQLSYFFLGNLLPLVNRSTVDAELFRFDERVFGFEPALSMDRWQTPATSAILARRHRSGLRSRFRRPPMLPLLSRSRRPIRHTVQIPCQIVRERDFRLVADRIVNLSLGGMLVGPADPVLTGEKIIVSFRSPIWGRWIDAEATVARVLHGRRPGEFRRALGLEFDGLDAWSRFVLEENLRRIPPAPPGPRRWTPDARRVLNALVRGGLRSARLA